MTKEERVIVSAYTGVLMCKFGDLHKYIEDKLGRSVFTHELANPEVVKEVKQAAREDFMKLCED